MAKGVFRRVGMTIVAAGNEAREAILSVRDGATFIGEFRGTWVPVEEEDQRRGGGEMTTKYDLPKLPSSADEADSMAEEREEWAAQARDRDQIGSAKEFGLTALLLRFVAATLRKSSHD